MDPVEEYIQMKMSNLPRLVISSLSVGLAKERYLLTFGEFESDAVETDICQDCSS